MGARSATDAPPERQYQRPSFLDGHTFPPPPVAGDTPWPYPAELAGRWAHGVWPRHASTGPSALTLRGLGTVPLATRGPDGSWVAPRAGVAALCARLTASGYGAPLGRSERYLSGAIAQALNDADWYRPAEPPPLTAAVAAAVTGALHVDHWEIDDLPGTPGLAGENLIRLGLRKVDEESSRVAWGDHSRRRQPWIDQSIAATGRTAPYRLRPLVLATENAARRLTLYRGWGVYDMAGEQDDAGGAANAIGALLAVYGHRVGAQWDEWHLAERDDDESPWLTDARFVGAQWGGYDFTRWARIHCAACGDLLYEYGRAQEAAAARDPAHFAPPEPPLPDGREYDVILT